MKFPKLGLGVATAGDDGLSLSGDESRSISEGGCTAAIAQLSNREHYLHNLTS